MEKCLEVVCGVLSHSSFYSFPAKISCQVASFPTITMARLVRGVYSFMTERYQVSVSEITRRSVGENVSNSGTDGQQDQLLHLRMQSLISIGCGNDIVDDKPAYVRHLFQLLLEKEHLLGLCISWQICPVPFSPGEV